MAIRLVPAAFHPCCQTASTPSANLTYPVDIGRCVVERQQPPRISRRAGFFRGPRRGRFERFRDGFSVCWVTKTKSQWLVAEQNQRADAEKPGIRALGNRVSSRDARLSKPQFRCVQGLETDQSRSRRKQILSCIVKKSENERSDAVTSGVAGDISGGSAREPGRFPRSFIGQHGWHARTDVGDRNYGR